MYCFTAKGHPAIKASHKTTMEFTKEKEVSETGDCITGVEADFDAGAVQELCRTGELVRVEITANGVVETFTAELNPGFSDNNELVIRMGEFASERTFAVRAEKSAKYLSGKLKKELKKPETVIKVCVKPNALHASLPRTRQCLQG